MSKFEELLKKDYEEFKKMKQDKQYLPWATAWSEIKKAYPDAVFTVLRDETMNMAFGDSEKGFFVFTSITANGETQEMHLPILDFKQKALVVPTVVDINKAVMRCLVKNCAMFGVGTYFFAGEEFFDQEVGKAKEDVIASINEVAKRLSQEFNKKEDVISIIGYGGHTNKIKTSEEAEKKLEQLENLLELATKEKPEEKTK